MPGGPDTWVDRRVSFILDTELGKLLMFYFSAGLALLQHKNSYTVKEDKSCQSFQANKIKDYSYRSS